jgi:hypothetical protein
VDPSITSPTTTYRGGAAGCYPRRRSAWAVTLHGEIWLYFSTIASLFVQLNFGLFVRSNVAARAMFRPFVSSGRVEDSQQLYGTVELCCVQNYFGLETFRKAD